MRALPAVGTLLLATLLASCAADAPTGAGPVALAQRGGAAPSRPLGGSCATTFQFIPLEFMTVPPGVLVPARASTPVEGECRIAHLGLTRVTIAQVVDFRVTPNTLTSSFVFTAANGDQLYASGTGTGSAPDAAGAVDIGGTFAITGGTGRFSGASGSASWAGGASLATLQGFFSLEGTIAY